MPTTTFTINLRLPQILRTVVIGSHLRTIRDVQRLGVFILAGGVRVGEGFLGEGGDASGLVVVVALLHLFLTALTMSLLSLLHDQSMALTGVPSYS